MWRRTLGLSLLALSPGLFAGCGGDKPVAASNGAKKSEAQGVAALPPRAVRVVRAETGHLSRVVPVAGTLAADEQAQLGLKVAGRLAVLAVDLGDRVRKGQVIARLSATDFELRVAQAQNLLEQARVRLGLATGEPDRPVAPEQLAVVKQAAATLRQAQLTRDRARSLFEQKLIAQSELDTAEAGLQVAEGRYQDSIEDARGRQALLAQRASELALARQALADSVLTAPFDGVIRERRVSAGDYVAVGQPVVVLVRVHPLRLRLPVPERDAAGVRVGQPVRLTVEGDPTAHAGRVARISPAISEDNRTLLVEAEVPNADGRLRPGSFARAEITVQDSAAAAPAVLVPASAIVSFAGIDKVMSIADGKAVEKRVRTGRRAGDQVEILEGVTAGDPLVVEPGNLVGGQPVRMAK